MGPKELADLRRKLLKDNPIFKRRLYDRLPKFQNQDAWRKPKGRDNKMRLQKKGYPPIVKVGYRNAEVIRGIHPSGYVPVVIHSEKDLEGLDPNKHIVYIGHTVGLRKRIVLEKLAFEKGFKIANAKVL
jgi:large subunit ribosomal protein L32e